jgi:predicted dehydrogenase
VSLRVGIVGFGDIAAYHARHLAGAGARVVGAVTSRQVPDGLARFGSLASMLGHVDAVTIAVPNHLHAALCIEAVEAGVAVFIEKPLCINDRELGSLATVLPQATRPVHVGFRLRCNPWLRAVRARIEEPRRVRCAYRLGIERLAAGKEWTRREAESGGAFCALGVHALDAARWLARASGRPLANLSAAATHRDDAADFPLVVSLAGSLEGGVTIEAAADLRGDTTFELQIEIDDRNGRLPIESIPGLRPEDAAAADAEYAAMLRLFVEGAEGGPSPPDEIAELLQCHRDLLRARTRAGGRANC